MNDLLAAVLAAPDDDTPRLVYADHLMETGDPYGELVFVQCERERLEREEQTTTLEYRRMRWREHDLLERQVKADYRRGFVHRFVFGHVPVVEDLQALRRESLAPLLESIVFGGDGAIELDARATFDALSELPSGRPLWLAEEGLPHPRLVHAVRSVRYRVPTERTIRDLVDADTPRLRRVDVLNGLRFTADAFERYAETPSYAQLDHLELWRLEGAPASRHLQRSPPRPSHLTVMLEDDARVELNHALRECPALPHVRELRVGVLFEREDLEHLGARATSLERWFAPFGIIGVDAYETLAQGPLPARLRHLEVGHCHANELVRLVNAPWQRLTSLAIGNAEVGVELVRAPALESLVELRLFGCEIARDVETAIRDRWPRVRIE